MTDIMAEDMRERMRSLEPGLISRDEALQALAELRPDPKAPFHDNYYDCINDCMAKLRGLEGK